MLERFAWALDWLGLVVFATTGALAASRKQMDVEGFALLATATGWVPAYLVVCVLSACVVFFSAHIPQKRAKAAAGSSRRR